MTAAPVSESIMPVSDDERRALAPHFDAAYYLSAYPDVATAGVDPLLHYYVTGWREGRNPSRGFNTLYYLRHYPDVASADINPLLHFVLAGEIEGRVATRPLDAWRLRLDGLRSGPPQYADDSRRSDLLTELELRTKLEPALSRGPLIVSVSHDDYATNTGGVQNLIADEERASSNLGWPYLHISPAVHRSVLSEQTAASAYQLGIRLGRDWVGYTNMAILLKALASLRAHTRRVEVVIHHMMAHSPELLRELVRVTACERTLVWAHDFFTVCPSYTLLRNDVVVCGGPPRASAACTICHYGDSRGEHLRRVGAFFEAVRPVLLVPSQATLADWRRMVNFPVTEAHVLPLGRLLLAPSTQSWAQGTEVQPIRIAHVGARVFHKGWPVFETLALSLRRDRRYRFFQFGRADDAPLPDCIRHVHVNVTRDTRHAMIDALTENNIDVVVNWSLWPETFCFAAYEAVASGAFLVTHTTAGNVPRMLVDNALDQGIVLANQAALFALFDSAALQRKLSQSRRRRGTIRLSTGTIGWLRAALGPRAAATHAKMASGARRETSMHV